MIIRFTKENWEKFFTYKKVSTFRIHPRKVGHYDVYGGSYYKPEKMGELDIMRVEPKKVTELTEQDAKDDGFNFKEELVKELKRLNTIDSRTILYKHWIENIKKEASNEERKV